MQSSWLPLFRKDGDGQLLRQCLLANYGQTDASLRGFKLLFGDSLRWWRDGGDVVMCEEAMKETTPTAPRAPRHTGGHC